MSYKVLTTLNFEREARRLKKKYRSLKSELQQLINQLAQDPTLGIEIGQGVHKIRLAIGSKGKGKRGGARVITYVLLKNEKVYLLSVYNKGEQDNISSKKIQEILDQIEEEEI